jgi:lia operon protein LiaG
MRRSPGLIGLITLLATMPATMPAPAAAQERFNVGGDRVAIYNIAGTVQVQGTPDGTVTVEVNRGGRDAGDLRVEVGRVDGRETLRVVYPSDRVVYSGRQGSGTTQLRVRGDGTWGGGSDGILSRGRTVRVSGSGRGTEAHADLRIAVPRGQTVDIHLAVGRITAENVDGRVRLDTHSGNVTARGMAGHLVVDTGSGSVEIDGMQGDLHIDTGSGSVRVAETVGREMLIETGSGRVVADGVRADRLVIDTGSGGIDLRRGSGRDVMLDTGSGSVNGELTGALDRLVVDTGSGSVTLTLPQDIGANLVIDTGSGGIDVDFPVQVTRRARGELRGVIGDGHASVRVDTGSGSVRLRAGS